MEELGFRSLGRRKFSLCKNIIRQGPWNLTMGLCNAPLSVFSLFPPPFPLWTLVSTGGGYAGIYLCREKWDDYSGFFQCAGDTKKEGVWLWKMERSIRWRKVEVRFMSDMLTHHSAHFVSQCFIWHQFQHSRTESSAMLLWIRSEWRSKSFGLNMMGSSYCYSLNWCWNERGNS